MVMSYQKPNPSAERPQGLQENVEDGVQQLRSKAGEAASALKQEGAKALEQAEQVAESAYNATSKFIRDQPLMAFGIVAGFAFTVGALWRLSSSRREASLFDRLSDYVEPQYRALRKRL
jgi:ElaB/YqjD/DUF883 family membrane-anchored ribosome-binding protein